AAPGIYELGGPDVDTFREMMQLMLRVIRRRALLIPVPFFVATAMGFVLDGVQKLSLGVIQNGVLTRDQVRNLRNDNVVTGPSGFDAFGIAPTAMEAVLPDYLWRFRPSGQYAEIKESARNLRTGSR
ncbi:MAG: complex I NDUFA9 subunit family protein, partial [Pseudomonadota bacterium]